MLEFIARTNLKNLKNGPPFPTSPHCNTTKTPANKNPAKSKTRIESIDAKSAAVKPYS